MTARETVLGLLRQWTERTGAAPETPDAVLDASDAELLREWAEKIREVGTAKGWSVWAAAFMDPDVPFVDTGMPSTETIVAELRRLDQAATLEEAATALETHSYACDCRRAAGFLRQTAASIRAETADTDEMAPEKDTRDGNQPPAGESTPEREFFQPGHTYSGKYGWRFRCDSITTHPEDDERTALGWRLWNGTWEPCQYGESDWGAHLAAGHTDITEDGS
ncbi:hypothetical protein [Streptomyces sp. NPDC001089]